MKSTAKMKNTAKMNGTAGSEAIQTLQILYIFERAVNNEIYTVFLHILIISIFFLIIVYKHMKINLACQLLRYLISER